jgi:hypothetical protein
VPRAAGRDIDDAALAHIWPARHENFYFHGTHSVNVDSELAKLDADGTGRCAPPPPRTPRVRRPRPAAGPASVRGSLYALTGADAKDAGGDVVFLASPRSGHGRR